METAIITYLGGLRTEATHLQSDQKILTDAPTDNHGKGAAFSPTDLLSTSLGCCILTTVAIVAERNNIETKGSKIHITKVMGSNPRRVIEIIAEIKFSCEFSVKEKELIEHAAITCPVARSLHPDLKQTITFHYAK
jgi:putative redox protein